MHRLALLSAACLTLLGYTRAARLAECQRQEFADGWKEAVEPSSRYFSGTVFRDDAVPKSLRDKLAAQISTLAREHNKMYHPGVNKTIRIYVDPSLYSFVKNLSVVKPKGASLDSPRMPGRVNHGETDLWGRPYVKTVYQWLPSYFDIDGNGDVSIRGYINGLNKLKYGSLYDHLAELFRTFLPDVETVLRKLKAPVGLDLPESFVNMSLQVMTRIVDYDLLPGQSHRGRWHVEGLPQENIVATAVYTLDRSKCLKGGGIEFLSHKEQNCAKTQSLSESIRSACNPGYCQKLQSSIVETLKGRLIVFPNSRVHRVARVTHCHDFALKNSRAARRRAIIFFVVNPFVRIISTAEIENLQLRHIPLDVFKHIQADQIRERIAYMRATIVANSFPI